MKVESWPVSRWLSFSIAIDPVGMALIPPRDRHSNRVNCSVWLRNLDELRHAPPTARARPPTAVGNSKPWNSERGGHRRHLRAHLNRRERAIFGASYDL